MQAQSAIQTERDQHKVLFFVDWTVIVTWDTSQLGVQVAEDPPENFCGNAEDGYKYKNDHKCATKSLRTEVIIQEFGYTTSSLFLIVSFYSNGTLSLSGNVKRLKAC